MNDSELLDRDRLSKKEKFEIVERIKNKLFNYFKQSKMLEKDKWDEHHLNGFSFGVMERVQKISKEK